VRREFIRLGLLAWRLTRAELVFEERVEVGEIVGGLFVAHGHRLMSLGGNSSSLGRTVNLSPYVVGRKECHRRQIQRSKGNRRPELMLRA
jgi:hypothetical protein